jgi:hypothetical protein
METPIGTKVAAAFVKAQKEFGPALKLSSNQAFKQNGKVSRYADLTSCLEAVMDALNNNGIALMQRTYECKDGVMLETVFLHESGEVLEGGLLHVPATKHDAHGYGSALTYARRYSLMATCGISAEDDDGNAASGKPEPKPTTKVDPSMMADHLAAIEACADMASLKTTYNAAYASCDGDAIWQAKVMAAKDKRKKELANG